MKHANRVGERCAGSGEGAEESADRGQDTENQLLQLREYCACQGWTIAIEYVDRMSGKTGDRETFKRLFIDASRRQFDVVVVWELDRFMRGGLLETFEYIATSRSPVSSSRARLTSAPAGQRTDARRRGGIAKQERLRISDRTKAGMEGARKQGKHCGRPPVVFLARSRSNFAGPA
jgi:DNA invertase Pin-like site-specific DNA recombinase